MFILKICEKNSSVNLRFEIFVVAFRARKLFGTFEKRAPGHVFVQKAFLVDLSASGELIFEGVIIGGNFAFQHGLGLTIKKTA